MNQHMSQLLKRNNNSNYSITTTIIALSTITVKGIIRDEMLIIKDMSIKTYVCTKLQQNKIEAIRW